MLNCSLSKNKSYQVQNIFFNSTDKSYQLTLAEKPANCADGVFSSKKLELKIVSNNTTPFLHFNKQDGVPELVLNNMSLVQQANSGQKQTNSIYTKTTEQNPIQNSVQNPAQNSGSHFSFLYVILGIVVIILIIRFISKRNQPPPYFPGNNNPNNPNNLLNGNNNPNNPNNPNYNPNNNPYNNQNNGPMGQQPPSRTGSFLTGLAGGAVGAVVANELYDKFKGHNEAQASQNTPNNSNDTFSSDNDSNFNNNNDSFSGDDNSSDDSFSSDD